LTAAAQLTNVHTSQAPSARPSVPGVSAARNDTDARRYLRFTLGHTLAMYGVLAAALFGAMPAWVLILVVPWLYVRLSLGLHELIHVRAAADVPAFHRLAMVFDTPFGLGYREHRTIHFRHHRFGGGERDPERWQIAGSHLRAFANAVTTPERSLVEWIRARGIDAPLVRAGAFRLVCFCAVVAINPAVFLVYWIVLRTTIGGGGFVFHHLLHNRRGALGTYALPFSQWVVRTGRVIVGVEPMLILTQHRSHHLWPDVRVRDLPHFPATFVLPPGPLAATVFDAAACLALPPKQ